MSENFLSENFEPTPLNSIDGWSPLSKDFKSGITQYTIRLQDHGAFYIQLHNVNCMVPGDLVGSSKTEGWPDTDKKNIKKIFNHIPTVLPQVEVIHFNPERNKPVTPVKVSEISVQCSCRSKDKSASRYQLFTSHCVGQYVAYDEDDLRLCFDIRPRFGEQLLAYMLTRIWRSVDSKKILQAVTEDATGSLIFLALVWMGTFSEAFKSGLPRLYVPKKGDIPALKGRLDINRMIKNRMTGRNLHLIPCRYRELSYDNIINRVIRRCYRIVRTILHGYLPDSVSGELGRVEKTLASYGVPFDRKIAPNDLDHIHYTSMAEAYEPLMKISKALIRSTPENLGGVLRQGQSFLFDITELWEFYMMAVLKEKLSGGYDIKTTNVGKENKVYYGESKVLLKDQEDEKKLFSLNPDILVYKKGQKENTPVAILDAKFKRINNNRGMNYGIEESDIRQLIAYCAGYACKKGALIYPWDLPLAFVSLKDGESKWHDTHQWKPSQKTWQTFSNDWIIRLHSFVLPVLFDELRNEILDDNLLYPFYKVQVEKGKVVTSLYWLRDDKNVSKINKIQALIREPPKNWVNKKWESFSDVAKYCVLMEGSDKNLEKLGLNKGMFEKYFEFENSYKTENSLENSPLPERFSHLGDIEKGIRSNIKGLNVKKILGRLPDFRTAIRKAEETFVDNIKKFLKMKDCG